MKCVIATARYGVIWLVCLCSVDVFAKEDTPQKIQPELMTEFTKLFGYLIVMVLVILASVWLLRRFGGYQYSSLGNMRVLDSLALGTREKILLVQIGEQQMILGVSPGRVENLYVLPKAIDTRARPQPPLRQWAMQMRDKWRQGQS